MMGVPCTFNDRTSLEICCLVGEVALSAKVFFFPRFKIFNTLEVEVKSWFDNSYILHKYCALMYIHCT